MSNWNVYYQCEDSLIQDMLRTKSNPAETPQYMLVKGYEYIESFKAYYQKHGCLTEKQMTQLKRLASAIYENVYNVQKL